MICIAQAVRDNIRLTHFETLRRQFDVPDHVNMTDDQIDEFIDSQPNSWLLDQISNAMEG